ncbi:major facilitator superfamily domain-containing protein [Microdochium trichocladiopsis]|uniref:Major facilitator superfamily domain-containing protein n=1 Tax=Microdochium trichocladiopsis TaxID=1682393 RepID=A0A9P8XX67_9PEZI|nr:major facilitator superfamily domain-containing protein [Microdochium trichocladiopsis]KAH7018103.1 major facilitator superfamily domain-containing protein [Microdochium trichocladiopsis]
MLSDLEAATAVGPGPGDGNVDDKYTRFGRWKRIRMVAVLCYYTFLTPISSTAVFVAIPEVVAELGSTPTVVNMSNALFFVFMALGPLLWGPLAQVVGRRPVLVASSVLMTAFSAGTAAAPNLVAYFIFRMLSAFQATAILVVGSVVIGDLYAPSNRGRAISAFLAGAFIAPAVAPILGGLAVTFSTWRAIFWVITILTAICTVLVVVVVEETAPEGALPINYDKNKDKATSSSSPRQSIRKAFNPGLVLVSLVREPGLCIAAIAVSAIIWNQYSMLAPIRYVINPRFSLTEPLQASLFFLPPASGCICGAFFGGWWSDYVASGQERKHGRRVPEHRLKSSVWLMAVPLPGFTMLYGWSVRHEVGGIPLVVVALFLQGFTQMLCLPGLNTYVVEAVQDRGMSSVAVAGNYLSRFMFAAAGTAACLPAINLIGVGWFSTISGLFIVFSAGLVFLLTVNGEKWRTENTKKEGGL